jgi:hypothetical protein
MFGLWRREGLESTYKGGAGSATRARRGAAEEGDSYSGGAIDGDQSTVTTVRAWDGTPAITDGAIGDSRLPLAGFSIIEAADVDEIIWLVAGAPCARAKGAIEIRPIIAINDDHPRSLTVVKETLEAAQSGRLFQKRTLYETRRGCHLQQSRTGWLPGPITPFSRKVALLSVAP